MTRPVVGVYVGGVDTYFLSGNVFINTIFLNSFYIKLVHSIGQKATSINLEISPFTWTENQGAVENAYRILCSTGPMKHCLK